MRPSVFVHLVTYNSGPELIASVQSVLDQGVDVDLRVVVRDNASAHSPEQQLLAAFKDRVIFKQNRDNLGFSAAHNQGVFEFLNSDAQYFCVLNPDVKLQARCLQNLVSALRDKPGVGLVTPLLLRCDEQLNPLLPEIVDAAGMRIEHSLRHFDRGSGEPLTVKFLESAYVFGGTGACLLLSREAIQKCLLPSDPSDSVLFSLMPALKSGSGQRSQLFDEAFFAYREDADLAWRAQRLGISCWYCAEARAYHRRVVTPERRKSLPPFLNLLGVRNRFLLQLNNWNHFLGARSFIQGILLRNAVVIAGVVFQEWSSIQGLIQAWGLRRRAGLLRAYVDERISDRAVAARRIAAWFSRDISSQA